MAKARKILKRVKAVKSIRTVTGTMEMVATARFRKAHQRASASKPYVERLAAIVRDLVGHGLDDIEHPLLHLTPGVNTTALLVIASNRGLAGAYNASVLRVAVERLRQLRSGGTHVKLYTVGKRGIQFMKFRRQEQAGTYTEFDNLPQFDRVRRIADGFMDDFVEGRIGGLEVAYMQFVSSGRQKPAIASILPLTELSGPAAASGGVAAANVSFELIPSAREIVSRLLPMSVRMKIFQCFLDAAVSEQIMRMGAMRAATENADEMIHSLTVKYNRTRQGQITTELAEIMGGRAGLEES